jgi:hypothetical protein
MDARDEYTGYTDKERLEAGGRREVGKSSERRA